MTRTAASVTRLKTAAPKAFKFTEATVRDLPGRADRYQVPDTEVKGLYVRVTPAGVKTYCVVKHSPVTGKVERVNIGTADDFTVKMARDEARAIIGKIATRQDIGGERRKTRATNAAGARTVRDMLEDYAANKRLRNGRTLAPRSLKTYTDNLGLLLGTYFDGPVDRLTADVVYSLYTARLKDKVVTRNGRAFKQGSLIGALGGIRALLAVMRFHEMDAQCAAIRRRIERVVNLRHQPVRAARVEAEDAQALVAWVVNDRKAHDTNSSRGTQHDMFLLSLSTGLRLRTLRALTWAMVNFKGASLKLPADALKNYKAVELPLPPRACAMLAARYKVRVSDYVFATEGSAAKGDAMGIDTSADWKACLPITLGLHDGRKAFTKALAATGAQDRCMGMLLTHAERTVTGIHYLQTTAMDYAKESKAAESWLYAKEGDKASFRKLDADARKRWDAYIARKHKWSFNYRNRRKVAAGGKAIKPKRKYG